MFASCPNLFEGVEEGIIYESDDDSDEITDEPAHFADSEESDTDETTEFEPCHMVVIRDTLIKEEAEVKSKVVREVDIGDVVYVTSLVVQDDRLRAQVQEGGWLTVKNFKTRKVFCKETFLDEDYENGLEEEPCSNRKSVRFASKGHTQYIPHPPSQVLRQSNASNGSTQLPGSFPSLLSTSGNLSNPNPTASPPPEVNMRDYGTRLYFSCSETDTSSLSNASITPTQQDHSFLPALMEDCKSRSENDDDLFESEDSSTKSSELRYEGLMSESETQV